MEVKVDIRIIYNFTGSFTVQIGDQQIYTNSNIQSVTEYLDGLGLSKPNVFSLISDSIMEVRELLKGSNLTSIDDVDSSDDSNKDIQH